MKLERLIKQQTLPKLLAIFSLIALVSALLSYLVIDNSLKQQHSAGLTTFGANLEQRLESFRQEVKNLSANDFIINSLIDYQVRDEHLPVFFRSLTRQDKTDCQYQGYCTSIFKRNIPL